MTTTAPDFSTYPHSLLVDKQEYPRELLRFLKDTSPSVASEAAKSCIANKAWPQLQAMVDAGFPISDLVTQGEEAPNMMETLLHRCVRQHLYDNLTGRLSQLLSMGADPKVENSQGITVLGLLMNNSRDIPTKMVKESFQVLSDYGVRMSDPCQTSKPGKTIEWLEGADAVTILATQCPELVEWATAIRDHEQLVSSTLNRPIHLKWLRLDSDNRACQNACHSAVTDLGSRAARHRSPETLCAQACMR